MHFRDTHTRVYARAHASTSGQEAKQSAAVSQRKLFTSFNCGQLNPAPSRLVHVAQARLNVVLLTLTRGFCRHTHRHSHEKGSVTGRNTLRATSSTPQLLCRKQAVFVKNELAATGRERLKKESEKQEKVIIVNVRMWPMGGACGGLPEFFLPSRQCISCVLDDVVAVAAGGHHLQRTPHRPEGPTVTSVSWLRHVCLF
jgi:hypothetical protein